MALDHDAPVGAVSAAYGSPTRRRLLVLLAGLPAAGMSDTAGGRTRLPASCPDPMPRLFAEVRTLLDRHEAALARCDAIEARLAATLGYPRVALPRAATGSLHYAADGLSVVAGVPPGRRRERRLRVLDARQRRWDAAAEAMGLAAAQIEEAALDTAVLTAADDLLAMPARTLRAVVLKLVVLLSLHEPGSAEAECPPWCELRLILHDLDRLAAGGDRT